MRHYYIYFLILIAFSKSFATEPEDKEDDAKSLILIRVGPQYRLPICVFQRHGEYRYTIHEHRSPYFFCPPEVPLTGEYKNCLLPFGAKEDQCKTRVEPDITKVINYYDETESQKSCFNSVGKLYEFAFHPCLKDRMFFGEETGDVFKLRKSIMYSICYDHEKERVIRITHTVLSPILLRNTFLKADREKEYEISTNDFGFFNNRFETLQKSYKEELEMGKLEMQYVVPPKQMAFRVWKRSVYHYINTKLVLKQTAEILKHADKFIKERAGELLGEIQIVDAFEFSDAGDIEIWSKTIYDESLSHGIIVIIHNSTKSPSKEEKLCSESICSQYGWEGIILNNSDSNIYCCATKELAKRFGLGPVKKVINLKSKWRHFIKSSHHRSEQLC